MQVDEAEVNGYMQCYAVRHTVVLYAVGIKKFPVMLLLRGTPKLSIPLVFVHSSFKVTGIHSGSFGTEHVSFIQFAHTIMMGHSRFLFFVAYSKRH